MFMIEENNGWIIFYSFAIERQRHCFYFYSNSFMIEENNGWIIFCIASLISM